jgi:hypothetical protein
MKQRNDDERPLGREALISWLQLMVMVRGCLLSIPRFKVAVSIFKLRLAASILPCFRLAADWRNYSA